MEKKPISQMYRRIEGDDFPETMELTFRSGKNSQTIVYEKVRWNIAGEERGLRYGENPGQQAALYRPVNGNLVLGECRTIEPGRYLSSDVELLQSGKHPGKTNTTDVDNALNILRYFHDENCVAIMKHNNPSGVAKGPSLAEAYVKAYMADRIAAFGGAVACSKTVDKKTAEIAADSYIEVIAAPDYEEGAARILSGRKNLRIIRVGNMDRLAGFVGTTVIDFKSLIDGGIIAQTSFVPRTLSREDLIHAAAEKDGGEIRIGRKPTEAEYDDLLFGWLVETGVTSNSILYVKDGVTVGIGTGEQDRVGVAEIARDKAYKKCADRISWQKYRKGLNEITDEAARGEVIREAEEQKGGLEGAVMVSDAFFPFRDGIEVGLREGVTAVIQPGGALRDYESIEACNEYNAAMVFTGQRCFKH